MKRTTRSQEPKNHLSLIAAIFIIATVGLSAHGADYGPKDYSIVPPAPQVEALMDYKEYPVNYFNGIPQINFTIYT